MRVAVLTNCASGARAAPPVRTRRIAEAFTGTGIRPSILCVPGHKIATTAADAATRADVVVAAGGDGTVGAVASALAGTDVAMAVLPMGTLNHFARDAGIPLDLETAAQAMVDASLRQAVDVAEVNGHVFVNNSSIGAYPRALHERDRSLQRVPGLSRRVAMVGAAWRVLRRLPAHHVVLSVDGSPHQRTTPCILVGNNPYDTSLGRVGRRPSLATGRLGVYTVRRASRAAVLGLTIRALAGRLDSARDFEVQEGREATIQAVRPRKLRVALDGEVQRLELPLRYRIRPRDLVLVGALPTPRDDRKEKGVEDVGSGPGQAGLA